MSDIVEKDLKKHQTIINQHLEKVGDASAASATTYSYPCTVTVAGAAGGILVVEFKKDGRVFAQFKGPTAGAIFGGYTGWGTAWFNKPVEELIGQSAAFVVEVVGVLGGTAHVQITNADNFIGNCSTGGIGAGGGLSTGGGTFSRV